MQESKSLLKAGRLKEKLGKQDFHYDTEEVFEPVTVKQAEATKNQKQLSGKQLQALRDSSETTVQAIENQAQAIRESSNIIKVYKTLSKGEYKNMMKLLTVKFGLSQILLIETKLISVMLRQFLICLMTKTKVKSVSEPVEGTPILFTINPHNPQQVLIKGSTMTFQNGNTYNINEPDLQYFITNTQFD